MLVDDNFNLSHLQQCWRTEHHDGRAKFGESEYQTKSEYEEEKNVKWQWNTFRLIISRIEKTSDYIEGIEGTDYIEVSSRVLV